MLAQAGEVRLVRGRTVPVPSDLEARRRIQRAITWMQDAPPFDRFRFRLADNDRQRIDRLRQGLVDTVHVLCIRVEFIEDTTPLTTGNGKMDTVGFWPGSPDETTLMCDPPHFKRYFERQMEGLRNYFLAMSLGRLYVDYRVVPDDEKSCYQLPRQMQFYGDTTSYEGVEYGLVRLLRDALKAADEDPAIHFGDYDEFIVFHAGSGLQSDYAADGVLDSPYDLLAGEIPPGALDAYLGEPHILVDSGRTRIEQATVLPEMMRQDTMTEYGTMNLLGMVGLAGTLCHEFAHLLGAYDLYDVTGVTMGVGGWSLMGYGGWLGDFGAGAPYGTIPGFLDAYHRVALGLVEPLVVDLPGDSVPVFAAAVDTSLFGIRGDSVSPTVIKIPISPREYFLVENRQTDIRKRDTIVVDMEDGVMIAVENNEYDFFQPGSGLLIWHVDEGVIADYGPYNAINIDPAHKGVDLEEGDGVQDFDVPYYRSYDPFYEVFGYRFDAFSKQGYNDKFTSATNPSSDGYTGKSFIDVMILGEADTARPLKDTVIYVNIGWELNQPGFPVRYEGRSVPFLSPFAADLDVDGSLEIVTIDTAGRISAWRMDGSGYRGGQAVLAETRSNTRADLAIGDVAGDNQPEVVAAGLDGRVRVFSSNGVLLRTLTTGADRIVAAPVLRDLDGDGKCEIVVGSTDRRLYAWHADGSLLDGFPAVLGSEIRAPVAVTDEPEPRLAVLSADSRLWLIQRDGSVSSGFPIQLGNSPFYVTSQPIVMDIDRDGQKELALVAGGEHDFRFYVVGFDGAIKARSQELIRWPFRGQLAVGDVDKDGYLDVLCASQHRVYAFNRNGVLVTGFPQKQESTYRRTELVGNWIVTYDAPFEYSSSPVLAEISGDGVPDICIGSPVYGMLGTDGRTGRPLQFFPLLATASVSSVPLLADLDRDGDIELAACADSGALYVWDLPAPADRVVWQCAYHDAAHTGLIPDTEQPALSAPDTAALAACYVYPNPAADQVNLRYRLGAGVTQVKAMLLDIAGDPVGPEMDAPAVAQADNELIIDLRAHVPGLYLVRLDVRAPTGRTVRFVRLAVVR